MKSVVQKILRLLTRELLYFIAVLYIQQGFFLERKALGIQHAELPYMETLWIERKTLHFCVFELVENLCS